jgi:hypothetical protein
MRLEPVQHVLQNLNAPHALIGAHAIAARGYPRFTIDADLHDAAALLALADSATVPDVERHIGDVRPDVRAVWRELLAGRHRGQSQRGPASDRRACRASPVCAVGFARRIVTRPHVQ